MARHSPEDAPVTRATRVDPELILELELCSAGSMGQALQRTLNNRSVMQDLHVRLVAFDSVALVR